MNVIMMVMVVVVAVVAMFAIAKVMVMMGREGRFPRFYLCKLPIDRPSGCYANLNKSTSMPASGRVVMGEPTNHTTSKQDHEREKA